eukprot:365019-Chlamydomonas_euryale.AAC.19
MSPTSKFPYLTACHAVPAESSSRACCTTLLCEAFRLPVGFASMTTGGGPCAGCALVAVDALEPSPLETRKIVLAGVLNQTQNEHAGALAATAAAALAPARLNAPRRPRALRLAQRHRGWITVVSAALAGSAHSGGGCRAGSLCVRRRVRPSHESNAHH